MGPGCVLSVWNSGRGVDRDMQREMERPFFSSKSEAGHGWGLLMVRRVVAETGGTLRVESGPGSGTRMVVFLPAKQNGVNVAGNAQSRRKNQILARAGR